MIWWQELGRRRFRDREKEEARPGSEVQRAQARGSRCLIRDREANKAGATVASAARHMTESVGRVVQVATSAVR